MRDVSNLALLNTRFTGCAGGLKFVEQHKQPPVFDRVFHLIAEEKAVTGPVDACIHRGCTLLQMKTPSMETAKRRPSA